MALTWVDISDITCNIDCKGAPILLSDLGFIRLHVRICGSRKLKTQITSKVKVQKMAIEVDVQMRDIASENMCLHCVSSCRRTK